MQTTDQTYRADGARYGAYEDVGDTYPVCDVCGDIGGLRDADKDCAECVARWEQEATR
jgi:hypothetical protein